ncbi:50S rRNA methyltransferase [Sulfurifustis variabilis]|uniref:50S rRNA methyltransferase n=1 Tax=Sulfurifustis variabilis TaxID=1675686 RepID=A0A1B4VGW6_9GAMM|nr:YkgJ family cysteine cluster protein [Sulfurifustis variabilis]BAU50107.1 50S rRNA methyltransferase [Sulfurifustis variabilis]
MSQEFSDRGVHDPRPSSPVVPVKLTLDSTIQFQCRKGIACFNKCCESIDIMLTPYDVLRLKTRLGMSSQEFLARHTTLFDMDAHGMPGLKMKTREGSTACQFLTPEGCGVYEDRPAACRYYALGLTSMRAVGSPNEEDFYFVVKEEHCLGHFEPRTLTVREYRAEQGVDLYDEMTRQWRQIVLKKRSSGPTVGRPTDRSFDLFFQASYDLDGFRGFVTSEGFVETYDVDPALMQKLGSDDVELMKFAFRFLKQALFGENTIPVRPDALEKRMQRRQRRLDAMRAAARTELEAEADRPDEN